MSAVAKFMFRLSAFPDGVASLFSEHGFRRNGAFRSLSLLLIALVALPLVSADITVYEETWNGPNACNVWPGWTYTFIGTPTCVEYAQNCSDAVSVCSVSISQATEGEHTLTKATALANIDGFRLVFHAKPRGSHVTAVQVGDGVDADTTSATAFIRGFSGNSGPVLATEFGAEALGAYPNLQEWYRYELHFTNLTNADPLLNSTVQLSVYRQSGALFARSTFLGHQIQTADYVMLLSCDRILACEGSIGTGPLIDEITLSQVTEGIQPDPTDADGDGINDFVELLLCGSADTRSVIAATDGVAGSCSTASNYVPPSTSVSVPLLKAPVVGPDADGDGFPSYILVERQTFHFDPLRPGQARFTPEPAILNHTIDPRDNDDDTPVSNTVCLPEIVPAVAPQADADGDGVPSRVLIVKNQVCVTATNPPTVTTVLVGALVDQQVDPNDNDPTTPVPPPPTPGRTFTTMDVVTGASWSEDNDNDKIPATLYLTFSNWTFDLDHPTAPPRQNTRVVPQTWDPNDNDRNNPILILTTADLDGDWIPDIVEPTLCNRQNSNIEEDGDCAAGGQNYHPPNWFNQVISAVP